MITVVGTVAFDTMGRVKRLAAHEETGGILDLTRDMPGGTAGNVVAALARLDARPRLVAAVGPDFRGSSYEAALVASGVDVGGLVRSSAPTSRAYIFYDDHGRQMTYFHAGASADLGRLDATVSGRVHFAAGEISAYPDLMRCADWVSFDPGQETFHRELDEIRACLPHVDALFLNRHELARLTAERGLDPDALRKEGVDIVVETRGADGCVIHGRGDPLHVPAVSVAVRDPTGGGDAHRAGFLYALDQGADLVAAARFANVLGSFAVEHVGPQSGLPTLQAARERYLASYPGPSP